MKPSHVAVEGPIGVGKTTLATRLARHWGAKAVLEDASNPFLAAFYEGDSHAAFPCQAWFLLMRHRQQRSLLQDDLFHRGTVTDYLFAKDRIFAYLNLSQADLEVYERLHAVLAEQVAKPDLVIYLQASDEVLLERIRKRARPAERAMTAEYVANLNRAYNHFFFHYTETPLLVVNASAADLSASDAELAELVRQVDALEGGTRYYVPSGG
jgi:deoxyguanosine kinase